MIHAWVGVALLFTGGVLGYFIADLMFISAESERKTAREDPQR